MNPTETKTEPRVPEGDPYFYGWRMVPKWDANGTGRWEKIPLTRWDVLHPEEEDFVVHTDAHDDDCHYLKATLAGLFRGRRDVKVFADMRVDWQIPGLGAHSPDLVVFEGLAEPWNRDRGTFPVKDMGARPLLAVEVVSPNTRDIDLEDKVTDYYRAGVPVYVLVNRREVDGRAFVTVFGYQHTPDGYVRLPEDRGGVWVEAAKVFVLPQGDRVVCLDETGNRIPDQPQLVEERDALKRLVETTAAEREAEVRRAEAERARAEAEKARAEEERARAEAEKARAEEERARADEALAVATAEKARADEAALKLAELEAEIRRLRSGPA